LFAVFHICLNRILLAALEFNQNQVVLKGIVECDDIFISCSQKGQRNFYREPRKIEKEILETKIRCFSIQKKK
jgi:hypothetical protein